MSTRISVSTNSFNTNLEAAGILVIIGLVFLLPIWFLPTSLFSVLFSKTLLAGLVAFLLSAAFILGRLKSGSLSIPRSFIALGALLLPVVYALSAYLSNSYHAAFLGLQIEVDTAFFVTIASLLLLLTALFVRTDQAVFNVAAATLGSFLLLSVYQIFHLLAGSDILSFGIFTKVSSTPLGSWVDLSSFAGLVALLLLVTLELLPTEKMTRLIIYVALLIASVFLVIVNTMAVWYVLASVTTFLALYRFSQASRGVAYNARHIPLRLVLAALISIFFIFFGPQVNARLSQSLGINEIEARPSWQGTYAVAKETVARSAWFGAGPNQFGREWNLYRPQEVNVTPFWNTDFDMGVGVVPTSLITTGVLGFLVWLILLLSVVWEGYRVLREPRADVFKHYLTIAIFGGALYFAQLLVLHVPSSTIYFLAFIFIGLFLALLRNRGTVKEMNLTFASHPLAGFGFVSLLIVLLAGAVMGLYLLVEKSAGLAFFNKAVYAYASSQDIDKAESLLERASRVDESDLYFRSLSQTRLMRLGSLFSQSATMPPDTVRAQFQVLLRDAIAYGQQAVAYDQYNYLNHLALAQAYESVVSLRVSNAYENAYSTYLTAQSFSPKNPALHLSLARLEILNGKPAEAVKYINEAFALKPDYTEAAFLRSQVAVSLGDEKEAVASAEKTVALAPNEPVAYFQLGLLYYNSNRYADTIAALERAVAIQSGYANARYFLGLSYAAVGRSAEAIAQFEAIQVTNPDNKEVASILENLRAGRPPLATPASAASNKPEKRSTLPLPESKKPASAF